jgi:hypothetical protein
MHVRAAREPRTQINHGVTEYAETYHGEAPVARMADRHLYRSASTYPGAFVDPSCPPPLRG